MESSSCPAQVALTRSPVSALHTIQVHTTNDSVVLHGRVGSYYCKQLAQESVMATLDGRQLVNNVEVVKKK